jgi:hypothetical protein
MKVRERGLAALAAVVKRRLQAQRESLPLTIMYRLHSAAVVIRRLAFLASPF